MVQCHPLDSLLSRAGNSPHEKMPLVHPPMVCEDDCRCFKENYETIPTLNAADIYAARKETSDVDVEG